MIIGITETKHITLIKTLRKYRRRIIKEHFSPDGMCYDSCLDLIKVIPKAKINQGYVISWNQFNDVFYHYWLTYKNLIIDITADQFNNELDHFQFKSIVCQPIKTLRFNKQPIYLKVKTQREAEDFVRSQNT